MTSTKYQFVGARGESRHGLHRRDPRRLGTGVEAWHEAIGEPTFADAILNWLVHNAYRLVRVRELRDQAVREGDQAYGTVVVRNGVIVGEGRSYVVLHNDPAAHAELLAVRDAARRLGTRDLSDCDVYSSATPCPMCQGALYWGPIRRVFTESTLEQGFAPKLGC